MSSISEKAQNTAVEHFQRDLKESFKKMYTVWYCRYEYGLRNGQRVVEINGFKLNFNSTFYMEN